MKDDMEKVLISEAKYWIKADLELLEKFRPRIEGIFVCLLKMGVVLGVQELDVFIKTVKEHPEKQRNQFLERFIREKLASTIPNPQIGGIKLSREKFMEMIEVPDCTPLIKALNAIIYKIDLGKVSFNYYSIVDDNIVVPGSSIESITEKHRIYATTPEQVAVYNWAKETLESLEKLKSSFGLQSNLLGVLASEKGECFIKPLEIISIK